MTDYVLGVDIGSGSVKLTLLSREGKIAATAGCEYPTYYPHVGWCEPVSYTHLTLPTKA